MTPDLQARTDVQAICQRINKLETGDIRVVGRSVIVPIAAYPYENMTLATNAAREAARQGYSVSHAQLSGKAQELRFMRLA